KKLRRFVPHLVTTAAIITSVELIQLFTLRGSADIDDLLLNVIGSALGYLVYLIASAICKRLRHSA
ncbi:MAG: VanZ family protein, partial [Clostridia bacterium]|nr:VanZ family protein [Clostridia bacterium]